MTIVTQFDGATFSPAALKDARVSPKGVDLSPEVLSKLTDKPVEKETMLQKMANAFAKPNETSITLAEVPKRSVIEEVGDTVSNDVQRVKDVAKTVEQHPEMNSIIQGFVSVSTTEGVAVTKGIRSVSPNNNVGNGPVIG